MRRNLALAPSFTLVIAFGALRAAGAEVPRDPAAAEALFNQGQALMEKGDFEHACPKLEESNRLDPATGALYALALCHERQGRLASAWVEFMDVASRANAERYEEREQQARKRAQAIKSRLSYLIVAVDGETASLAGLVITRDGVPLGPAAWGTAIPIDPGPHEVVARAPGYEPWTRSLSVATGPSSASVEVPKLTRLAPRRTPGSAPLTTPSRPEFLGLPLTPTRVGAIALGAAAAVSFGLAGYSGVRAIVKNSDSKRECGPSSCEPGGERNRLAAYEAANLATVSAITGGVLLAAGVTLFVIGAPRSAQTALAASPGGMSLRTTF